MGIYDITPGIVLLVCMVHLADCEMTYHIAFLQTDPAGSQNDNFSWLRYQNSAIQPSVTSKTDCSWSQVDSSSDNLKLLNPSGDCSGHVPSAVGITASGLKVVSEDDIVLHVFQRDSSNQFQEGYRAIPDRHLGKEYYVITYCSLGGFCQFAVAGTVDGTAVNIVFPSGVSTDAVQCNGQTLADRAPPGDPVPFTLNEYDVLFIESKGDLSGTYISADNNVAVIIGTRNTQDTGSFMIEQIPPVNKWGTDFVVAPNYLNEAGDVIKIVTQGENTNVHILGFSSFEISGKGGYSENRIDWEMHSKITTSKPVLIVQVMSINLYNDSTAVTGHPAMVLVQHVKQWGNSTVYFDCLQLSQNESVVTVVAGSPQSVAWMPSTDDQFTWTEVDGTSYEVLSVRPLAVPPEVERTLYEGTSRSTYGYCGGKSAFLLDVDWEWENEGCEITVPVPADGVDNNCDGKIDEVNCTEADRAVHFTSKQDSTTGVINFKALLVKGLDEITFTVRSCDIAVVTLHTYTSPEQSYTAYISPENVTTQICTPKCEMAHAIVNDDTVCTIAQTYNMAWNGVNGDTTHTFSSDVSQTSQLISGQDISYDVLYMSSYVGETAFVVELLEKDCTNIISAEPDNHGKNFVLSLKDIDYDIRVLITNPNNATTAISIKAYNADGDSVGDVLQREVDSQQTLTVTKNELPGQFRKLIIKAEEEVSVYLLRKDNNLVHLFVHQVLPTDILGPYYHLFLESNTTSSSGIVCTAHTFEGPTVTNAGGDPVEGTIKITKAIYDTDLGYQHLFEANRPVAVFCGGTDNIAQMPPRETLGTQHYIPELDLEALVADAKINLVATEDSTVVTIRGNYDQLDKVKLTGNVHTREVVTGMIYNITSTKPIQVHLQIEKTTSPVWKSAIVIPPVEQYKTKHVLPGFPDLGASIEQTTAVDDSGSPVSVLYNAPLTAPQAVSYPSPVFSLTVLQSTTLSSNFIIPSDVKFKEINTICVQTAGEPGDGKDNDCDGLIDEEQWTDKIVPGIIDVDIDGSINEDCAAATKEPTSPITLSLASVASSCPTYNVDEGIDINNGMVAISDCCGTSPDVKTSSGSEAPYTPIEDGGVVIGIPTTTPLPGSTAAPVETCTTTCLVPCDWCNPQNAKNYTEEELQATIVAIQEKLKVSKMSLSATIRSKTSAPDNRVQAATVGYIGVAFLATMLGSLVLLDLTTITRDVKVLINNMREVFQP